MERLAADHDRQVIHAIDESVSALSWRSCVSLPPHPVERGPAGRLARSPSNDAAMLTVESALIKHGLAMQVVRVRHLIGTWSLFTGWF